MNQWIGRPGITTSSDCPNNVRKFGPLWTAPLGQQSRKSAPTSYDGTVRTLVTVAMVPNIDSYLVALVLPNVPNEGTIAEDAWATFVDGWKLRGTTSLRTASRDLY